MVTAGLIAGACSATTAPTTTPPPPPGPAGVSVFEPDSLVAAPTVVIVHGGGWIGGEPLSTEPLARGLADRGALAFNLSYAIGGAGGYPTTFDDIACGMAYARSEAKRLGGSEDIILVGHSAGAHMALVAALSPATFGPDCAWDTHWTPAAFVGLAGFYRIDIVEFIMNTFLGGRRDDIPDTWLAVDPFALLTEPPPFPVLLIHGTDDRVAPPSMSVQLHDQLAELGADVDLIEIEGASHGDVNDPEVVGDRILENWDLP